MNPIGSYLLGPRTTQDYLCYDDHSSNRDRSKGAANRSAVRNTTLTHAKLYDAGKQSHHNISNVVCMIEGRA